MSTDPSPPAGFLCARSKAVSAQGGRILHHLLASRPSSGQTPQTHLAWHLSDAPGVFVDTVVAEMFIVAQYLDGLAGLFSDFTTIATPLAGLTGLANERIFGGDGQAALWSSGIDQVSINGAPFSNQLLPCPRSILRFSSERTAWPAGFLTGAFGSKNHDRPRGWRGEMHEIMLFDRALTSEEVTDVENHLSNKWGI